MIDSLRVPRVTTLPNSGCVAGATVDQLRTATALKTIALVSKKHLNSPIGFFWRRPVMVRVRGKLGKKGIH
jgi:hypothetical protein